MCVMQIVKPCEIAIQHQNYAVGSNFFPSLSLMCCCHLRGKALHNGSFLSKLLTFNSKEDVPINLVILMWLASHHISLLAKN